MNLDQVLAAWGWRAYGDAWAANDPDTGAGVTFRIPAGGTVADAYDASDPATLAKLQAAIAGAVAQVQQPSQAPDDFSQIAAGSFNPAAAAAWGFRFWFDDPANGGQVYAANDPDTGEQFAVRIIYGGNLGQAVDVSGKPLLVQKFLGSVIFLNGAPIVVPIETPEPPFRLPPVVETPVDSPPTLPPVVVDVQGKPKTSLLFWLLVGAAVYAVAKN